VGVAHHVVHHTDVALSGPERSQRGAERMTVDQPVPSPSAGRGAGLFERDVDTPPLPASPDVQARVHEDPVEPGGRRRLAPELIAAGEGTDIRFLHHIVGLVLLDESRRDVAQLTVRLNVGVGKSRPDRHHPVIPIWGKKVPRLRLSARICRRGGRTVTRTLIAVGLFLFVLTGLAIVQDAKTVLDNTSKAMGTAGLTSITYSVPPMT